MSTTETIDAIVQQVDRKMDELRPAYDEYRTLEAVKAQMQNLVLKLPGQNGNDRNGHGEYDHERDFRDMSDYNKRGQTMKAIRSAVTANPGLTVPEIADRLSKKPSYIYAAVLKLVERGELRRSKHRIYPVTKPEQLPDT